MPTDLNPLFSHLQEVARQRSTTCYASIADLIGLDMASPYDRKRIGDVLGELSEREHTQGRPMISAVVVTADAGMPGGGFFELARRLGLWTVGDKDGFYVRELRRVHDYWSETPAIQSATSPTTPKATPDVVVDPATSSSEQIVQRLLHVGKGIGPAELVFKLDPLVGNLVKDDPFAFLLAASVDRGMKAEQAWRLPAKIKEILGHLDPARIAEMTSDAMLDVLRRVDGKPRYLSDAARTLVEVGQRVAGDYDGDARNLWKEQPAAMIRARLERIYGIGPGIASMVVILLDRLGEVTLRPEDYEQMDPKPDVHLKRVFARLGLCGQDPTENEVIETARRLHPPYPGVVDGPCWHIGRTWCHAEEPDCGGCPMNDLCPKLF